MVLAHRDWWLFFIRLEFSMRFVRAQSVSGKKSVVKRAAAVAIESLESRQFLSATLWVSTTGNDSAGGTQSAPLRTLKQALAKVSAGDTINLMSGTYQGGVFVEKPNITIESAPGQHAAITSSNADSGPIATIDYDLGANNGKLLNLDISGGSYYAIKTESNYDTGVSSQYGVSGLLIQNSKIHDSGRDVVKITPGSDHVTMIGDEIYNSGRRDPSNAEGVDNVNGSYFTMNDCYVHDIATNGIYVKGGAVGTLIENSKFSNIGLGGILLGQDTDYQWFNHSVDPGLYENINGVVKNNVVMNAKYAGIGIWGAENATVTGNTVINSATAGQGGIFVTGIDHYLPPSYSSAVHQTSRNVTITNNTVSMNSSNPAVDIRSGGLSGSLTMGGNHYASTSGAPTFWYEDKNYYGSLSGGWMSTANDGGSSIVGALNPSSYSGWTAPTSTPTPAPTPAPTPTPTPTPTKVIGTGNGLTGTYFNNMTLTGAAVVTRVDRQVNFNWGWNAPDPRLSADHTSTRWTGHVQAETTGTYTFYTNSDDGVRLWVNGQLVVNNWTSHGVTQNKGTINLVAGQKYTIKMEYFENAGTATAQLLWSGPNVPVQAIPQSQLYSV
jgi:parallel beta-helix repeat protein